MAWWDQLFMPFTQAPIPPALGVPPGMGPFKYGPQDRFGVAGVQNEVFGGPHAPVSPTTGLPTIPSLPPNIEARGPGYEIMRPPVPPVPRNPSPASSPMMPPIDTLPAINSAPYSTPPVATTSAAPKPNWWERNKDLVGEDGKLWDFLKGMGQGLAFAPPGTSWMGALAQGAASGNKFIDDASDRRLNRALKKAQVGEAEQKVATRKRAAEIAASLPADHPARGFFALGMVEEGLKRLTPDWNQLIVVGPDGKPQLNETLVRAKAYITAAGAMKPQYGITGYDIGGKPIHGWVTPPAMPGLEPTSSVPTGPAVPAVPGGPRAVPGATSSQPPQTAEAAPAPPPGVDPYKWAEEQAKAKIQKQAMETARKRNAPIVVQDIDRALKRVEDQGWYAPQTGFGGMVLNQVGMNQLARVLQGVQANIGFDALNQMRADSPTGAALGQVTERELAFLQSVYGSLSVATTQEELKFNLKRLKNAMLDVIHGPGQGPPREDLSKLPASPEKKDGWQDLGDGFRVRQR